MANDFTGKTRHLTGSPISDLDGSRIMRGLLIGLAISIVFWATLAFLLL
jgi:hypothetical protein